MHVSELSHSINNTVIIPERFDPKIWFSWLQLNMKRKHIKTFWYNNLVVYATRKFTNVLHHLSCGCVMVLPFAALPGSTASRGQVVASFPGLWPGFLHNIGTKSRQRTGNVQFSNLLPVAACLVGYKGRVSICFLKQCMWCSCLGYTRWVGETGIQCMWCSCLGYTRWVGETGIQ